VPSGRGEEETSIASRGIFLPLAAFVVLVDQLTKALAQFFLSPGISHPVLPPIFHLTLVENRGIAFGFFQGGDKILFVVITVSILVLAVIGFRTSPERVRNHLGIGLILGGALGNWVDRIRIGAVVDFLGFWIWPVFNLADTAITVGVGIFLLRFLFLRHAS